MKEQLKLLEELQRVDARIQELEGARKAIPAKLDSMRTDLSRVEEMVAREKAELEDNERWRTKTETDMRAETDQLAKTRAKLSQVKTSKEYMATQREMETNRRVTEEAEQQLAKMVETADAARARIAQREKDLAGLRELVAREDEAAKGKLATLDGELAKARAEREAATKAVKPEVLKRYSHIRMRRGLAVVPVKAGTCAGCHMNIPPQLFNTLQRMNSLELCPNCNRIIYWDKMMEDPDGKPSEKAEPAEK